MPKAILTHSHKKRNPHLQTKISLNSKFWPPVWDEIGFLKKYRTKTVLKLKAGNLKRVETIEISKKEILSTSHRIGWKRHLFRKNPRGTSRKLNWSLRARLKMNVSKGGVCFLISGPSTLIHDRPLWCMTVQDWYLAVRSSFELINSFEKLNTKL